MTDIEVSKQGMTRRDVMRRGAVIGGTLVWAAPTVQALGPRAFAQGPGTPGVQDCEFLLKDKWDWNGTTFVQDCGDTAPFCDGNGQPLDGWDDHECCTLLSNITVVESDDDGDPTRVTATLREDCDFEQGGAAASKGGTDCAPAAFDPATRTLTFVMERPAISYIAVMVCCDHPC